TGPTAFGLTRTDVPALTWTSEQAIHDALALPAGGNVFRLDTAPLLAALRALPGVADASVTVELPDAVVAVRVQERVPVLAWQVGTTRYIADRNGVVFATLASDAKLPAGVAIIEDDRPVPDPALAIGAHIDAVDLDVATRLGSLTPDQVGSTARSLRVAITDRDGFVLVAQGGWTAVFGFYSPATRSTDMIPGQVRLLRSLIDSREATIARIILASDTDGTYVPRATPKPTPR
ncbi:MAG TPA: FtsQ-type POTRA domain-containing protein, partial [Candidatus Limnocylindrales bacterium]|nr:FtsQ-type POTRA domain-containing protein [Candidatus Limnocylindrales bacterium]